MIRIEPKITNDMQPYSELLQGASRTAGPDFPAILLVEIEFSDWLAIFRTTNFYRSPLNECCAQGTQPVGIFPENASYYLC